VERGGKLFVTNCGGCHGATARGGVGAPDLIRSVLVLDDEKGILIAPVIRNGRLEQGMPASSLSDAQIADIVAWLHVQTYAAGHRSTYAFQDVLTGDPKRRGILQSAGTCHTCHSPTGDLKVWAAGMPRYLAGTLAEPTRRRRRTRRSGSAASTRSAITVTVTPSSGRRSGTLDRVDDFSVSCVTRRRLSSLRSGASPKSKFTIPSAQRLLGKYTDADMHNLTAYLVTLKRIPHLLFSMIRPFPRALRAGLTQPPLANSRPMPGPPTMATIPAAVSVRSR
jgi:mono/diheme cytochrome c family protein